MTQRLDQGVPISFVVRAVNRDKEKVRRGVFEKCVKARLISCLEFVTEIEGNAEVVAIRLADDDERVFDIGDVKAAWR